jgi:hypothetical protein
MTATHEEISHALAEMCKGLEERAKKAEEEVRRLKECAAAQQDVRVVRLEMGIDGRSLIATVPFADKETEEKMARTAAKIITTFAKTIHAVAENLEWVNREALNHE